ESAFATCISLTSFIIPPTVKTIGDYAFQFCRMSSITSYATTPPACGEKCFEGVGKSIPVYVPMYSISAYKQAAEWKEFTNILPIAAEDVPIIEPIITPDDYSVTIIWPQNENADTYTIEITKDGELFCTLTFNRQGQLTIIAFAAPIRGEGRKVSEAEMTANGYRFTITGLDSGTEYSYTVTAKDASEQVIQTHSGKFITTSATGLEDLTIDKKVGTKFIYGNQLYIRHNGHLHTATGAKVK
ncbi:MAG: leucine-rich repeat protein, partial [Bacteroidales bacterium]|nr:leucine-rich repeat protein [Candidatus Colicola equi]